PRLPSILFLIGSSVLFVAHMLLLGVAERRRPLGVALTPTDDGPPPVGPGADPQGPATPLSGPPGTAVARKTAPCGSARMVNRPTGMSIGGSSTAPPSSAAPAAAWSASGTQNVTLQRGVGSSPGAGACPPPTSRSPRVKLVRGSGPGTSWADQPSRSPENPAPPTRHP